MSTLVLGLNPEKSFEINVFFALIVTPHSRDFRPVGKMLSLIFLQAEVKFSNIS